jgi:hypothetical protein
MSCIHCHALALAAGVLAFAATPARAQIDPLVAYPSTTPSPASAISAARALTDRWLGEDPTDNPAATGEAMMSVSPLLQRVSRQDLRAITTNYDETAAFIDLAGGWLRGSVGKSPWSLAVYAYQPALRLEESAFTFGDVGGPTPVVSMRQTSSSREIRAGAALAWSRGAWSAGVAPEWTRRSDRFERAIEEGVPEPSTRIVDIEGDGVGGQAGVRFALPPSQLGGLTVGAAARYVPELPLSGSNVSDPSDSTDITFDLTRESAWEGGVSVASTLGQAWRVIAGFGGRSAMDWQVAGASTGQSSQLGLGVEYHDPAEAWTVRAGYGRESNPGSAEPKAGVLGLGFGWTLDHLTLDFGLLHRSLERPDAPTSYDDRVLATVGYSFGKH